MKLRCFADHGDGTQSAEKMPGNDYDPRHKHPAIDSALYAPVCAA
jgi:hypothetical protein